MPRSNLVALRMNATWHTMNMYHAQPTYAHMGATADAHKNPIQSAKNAKEKKKCASDVLGLRTTSRQLLFFFAYAPAVTSSSSYRSRSRSSKMSSSSSSYNALAAARTPRNGQKTAL